MAIELEIEIAPDGTVKLHIQGAAGKKCADTVELFKKLVGPASTSKWTSEYYEEEAHITRDIRKT